MAEFNYVIVFVSDMARSVAFYRDILGLSLRSESPKWTEFETPGTMLALHLADAPSGKMISADSIPAGQCHLGFAVEDLDAFHAEMVANGVPCLQPPQDEEYGGRLAGYADPDGQPLWVSEGSKKP